MDIIVCIKAIPDTDTEIKITSDGKSIEKNDCIINPFDEYAMEQALILKEIFGGQITVLTLGDDTVKEALHRCLALGADKAVHLKLDTYSLFDPYQIAKIISQSIEKQSFDIILTGHCSTDTDHSQTGPMVAQFLDIAHINAVISLNITDKKITAVRQIESATETIETRLPAVITAQKGLNDPRQPTLKGIRTAKTKQTVEIDISELDDFAEVIGSSCEKTQIVKMEPIKTSRSGEIIDGKPDDCARNIAKLLCNV